MKRFLVTVALLIGLTQLVSAAITLVQSNTSTSGNMWVAGSLDETLNFPGAVTVGNTVVAWTGWAHDGRTMSCTHDGNAMTQIINKGGSVALTTVSAFARVATTTGTGVTCTISASDANAQQAFAIAEFSGMAATLSTSGGAGVSATTAAEFAAATTHDSGADLTPDTADNLFIGVLHSFGNGGTWGDDGFTMLISTIVARFGYKIQAAATAGDWVPTSSNSVDTEIGAVNLDGAAGGAVTSPSSLTLTGVGR